MPITKMISIPNRSGPRSKATGSSAVNLKSTVGNWTTVGQRQRRGGKSVQTKRDKRKVRSVSLKFGTLNLGTITGKSRELADMMERKVDILCVLENRLTGRKAKNIGGGYKLFFNGVDRKDRNLVDFSKRI